MSRFFVGQQVRIVGATSAKELIGTETRVIALNVSAWAEALGDYVGVEVCARLRNGRTFVAIDGQLEPILDSHQPCESDFKESMDKLLEGLPA